MVAEFGSDSHVCAVVDSIGVEDLDRCATEFAKSGPPPLLIPLHELERSLDAFPLEFNEILATRRVIAGVDLFAALTVPPEEVRRACEMQARAHLVHLREAYIEAAGDTKAIARLVAASETPFRALLTSIARLDNTTGDELARRLHLDTRTFATALPSAERLVDYVDRWKMT